jgi:hypothetical protein
MPCHFIRRQRSLLAGAIYLVCFLLSPACFAAAQTAAHNSSALKLGDAVATLVEKIAASADRSKPASLEVKNISSLNRMEVSAIGQEIEAELGKRLRLAPKSQAQTQIVVTLSEGASGYVWVAQVRSGSGAQTAMVAIPKEETAGVARHEPLAMSLERKLVWSQPQPFLDFALTGATAPGAPGMIVLEASRMVFYTSENGRWVAGKAIPLQPAAALPRDTRGMVWQSAGEIEMLIPGESCSGTIANLPELACAPFPATNPGMNWPVVTGGAGHDVAGFSGDRNFFDGSLAPAGGDGVSGGPPFFSIAFPDTTSGLGVLEAGLDGRTGLYEHGSAAATFSGWGDDIATIDTGCNDVWQVLTTGTGDWTQPDHIQIYEIRNYPQFQSSTEPTGSPAQAGNAEAVGQPLDFSGPIFALWSAADQKTARAVSLNLQTGMYEGSIISVTCGQ